MKRGHGDFLCLEAVQDPWKPVSGEGRARCREPVIVVKNVKGSPMKADLNKGVKSFLDITPSAG